MPTLPTGIVTFLFTDIENSTGLQSRFPSDAYPEVYSGLLTRYGDLVRETVHAAGGYVFLYVGDGCDIVFANAKAALSTAHRLATAAQRMPVADLHPQMPVLRMRQALHTGLVSKVKGIYHGTSLSIVNRLLDLPNGDQIIVSEATLRAQDGLPADTSARDLGEHYLRNVPEPVHVFQLLGPGLSSAPPRLTWDPERLIVPSSKPIAYADLGVMVNAVVRSARGGSPARLSRAQLQQLVALPAEDLTGYRVARIATWCEGRFELDKRFVRMTIQAGRGLETADGDSEPPRRFPDLRPALDEIEAPALVLVGAPGSGKTTLLRRLELDLAVHGLAEPSAKITYLLALGSYPADEADPWRWLQARWAARFSGMPSLAELLAARRMVFLLDGLNEMPHTSDRDYRELVGRWRRFLAGPLADQPGNRAIFSCRTLDYSMPLSTSEQRVPQLVLEPLDDAQVQAFLAAYCPAATAQQAWERLAGTAELELVRTPYFLQLMAQQAEASGRLPEGRSALFTSFVRRALQREIERENPGFEPDTVLTHSDYVKAAHDQHWRDAYELPAEGPLDTGLRDLATGMQRSRPSLESAQVRVAAAEATRLIGGPCPQAVLQAGLDLGELDQDRAAGDVLFRHQLLQEYFAARELARSPEPALARSAWRVTDIRPSLDETLSQLAPPDPLPPPPATGWEETMVLAAAMAEDPAGFILQLADDNLPLAGRCAAQPDVRLPSELLDDVRWRLVRRSRDPGADLRARIAAGLALGPLGDPRFERHWGPYGEYLLPPFVEIPGGTYTIGCNDGPYPEEEAPEHPVEIAPFKLAMFPVTNAEWALFMKAGGYEDERWWETEDAKRWRRGEGTKEARRWNITLQRNEYKNRPHELGKKLATGEISHDEHETWQRLLAMSDEKLEQHLNYVVVDVQFSEPAMWQSSDFRSPALPVTGVSWFEALAYCRWLEMQSGIAFRLPSEAEWESAARGHDRRCYAFGSAFHSEHCNTLESHLRRTTPIGSFPGGDSPLGLTDMTGNVFEWTRSMFGSDARPRMYCYPYDVADGREDPAADSLVHRVARGGSWARRNVDARVSCRYWNPPSARYNSLGIRIAM